MSDIRTVGELMAALAALAAYPLDTPVMISGDHHDGIGGCWGISHGLVAAHGDTYCAGCELKVPAGGAR